MPGITRKVVHQGVEYTGDPVQVVADHEHWNEYQLADGAVIRAKMVATEILRLHGVTTSDGGPAYLVQSQTVMAPVVAGRQSGQ